MQLQIYIIFDKLWHKMSFKQRIFYFIYFFFNMETRLTHKAWMPL